MLKPKMTNMHGDVLDNGVHITIPTHFSTCAGYRVFSVLDTTKLHIMDMQNSDEFINASASMGSSLGLRWINEGPVAVMIASNFGRPGGECSVMKWSDREKKRYFTFQPHASSATQEESVLTYIHSLTDRTEIPKILNRFRLRYGMGNATESMQDYLVKKVELNGGCQNQPGTFNVRTSGNASDYAREFGDKVRIIPPIGRSRVAVPHQIYLSFVTGPNASAPPAGGARWTSRLPRVSGHITPLDTKFRTISYAALDDYGVFRKMIMAALVASLSTMACQQYHRVIIAPISTGVYAGHWKDRVRLDFYTICLEALGHTYKKNLFRFQDVLIPRFVKR